MAGLGGFAEGAQAMSPKKCRQCGEEKQNHDFYSDKSKKDGLMNRCKACDSEKQRILNNRKKEEIMSELVHTKQLAEEFGIAESLASSYLATAKIAAHKLVVGKDTLNLFDKVQASKAIGQRVKEEKEIQTANLARLEAAKIPTLKDVMLNLKAIAGDISDVAELAEGVKKLHEQNVCMFKVITEMKQEMQTRFIEMHAIGKGQQSEAKQPQLREPTPSVSPLKVGIVGLHSGEHAALKKDFGDLFRLSILTPDESRKITGYKGMDKTYLMSKYVSHRHMDLLKSIGQTPIIIPGTVNDLRDALTALYLE